MRENKEMSERNKRPERALKNADSPVAQLKPTWLEKGKT